MTKLARKLRISKQAVRYRINRLVKNEIIQKFFTIINTSFLGYHHYYFFVSFNSLGHGDKISITEFLKKSDKVATYSICDGPHNLLIGLIVKDQDSFYEEISKFFSYFSRKIRSKQVIRIIEAKLFGRNYLIKEENGSLAEWSFSSRKIKLKSIDTLDRGIISFLVEDATISATRIAEKVGTSATTVIKRIKNLEVEGIIQGYSILLNEAIFATRFLLLELCSLPRNVEIKLWAYAQFNPHITYIAKTFGTFDFIMTIETRNLQEYLSVVEGIKNEFSEFLSAFVPLLVIETPKIKFLT